MTTGGADLAADRRRRHQLRDAKRTDRFRGSGRFYLTDESLQADNLTDEVKLGGVGGGAPIQNIKDYGFEVGGPIMKGKLWYWGSYGKQDIKAGIPGFYPDGADHEGRAGSRSAGADPTDDVRACLGTDGTEAEQLQLEGPVGAVRGQQVRIPEHVGGEVQERAECLRHAADRDDLPPESRVERVRHVRLDDGPDAVVEGERPAHHQRPLAVDVQWVAPGEQLHARLPRGRSRRRAADGSSSPLACGPSRSTGRAVHPPTHSFDATTSYFLPGAAAATTPRRDSAGAPPRSLGGARRRSDERYINGVAREAEMHRDSITDYYLSTYAAR